MPFKITTLVENSSEFTYLAAEHGLSILIEGNGKKVLYDTGPSPRFLLNARTMAVDLEQLDAIVLSHGHYDHTGGTAALLGRTNKPQAIYAGNNFHKRRFSIKADGALIDLSATTEKEMIDNSKVAFCEVGENPISLGEGIWVLSGFQSIDEYEKPSPNAVCFQNSKRIIDRFEDEVVLVLETGEGLTMISGCSHTGIISMCIRVKEVFNKPVCTFIGGTHLMIASTERIQHTCERLKELGIKRLGACHCNGEQASEYFMDHFPGYFVNRTGTVIELND